MVHKIYTFFSCFIMLLLVVAGCTINNTFNTSSKPVTKKDLWAATQIIGESISSKGSGAVLSISDALAILASKSSISSKTLSAKQLPGNANKQNYSRHYNPKTGVHTVSFIRKVKHPFLGSPLQIPLNTFTVIAKATL